MSQVVVAELVARPWSVEVGAGQGWALVDVVRDGDPLVALETA